MSGLSWEDAAKLTKKIKRDRDGDSSFGNFCAIGVMFILLVLFVVAPLCIYFIWSSALVGKILWAWFVVPTFGLPALTWAQAWGLSIIVGYWAHVHHTDTQEDERETSAKIAAFVILMLKPWIVLSIAYVCHHWYMPLAH